jgi:hypothetical protein
MEHAPKPDVKPLIDKWRSTAMMAAGAGVVVAGIAYFAGGGTFFHSYMFAYMFWFNLALGSLAGLMLHHMVGGGWGFMVQRILEAGAKTLPLMAVLFVPIYLGRRNIYKWADAWAEHPLYDHFTWSLLAEKDFFLSPNFWILRTALYFTLWITVAYLLTSWSKNLDSTGNLKYINRFRKLSPIAVVFYFISMTLAATDWVKSIEKEWFSTMYGPIFIVGQGLATLAFCIILLSVFHKYAPLSRVFRINFFHHIGTLMCAFVVLWAYTSFGQYLIIWSGNLPEESVWYVNRTAGFLTVVAVTLMIGHFGIPLLVLLQRQVKRNIKGLRNVAIGILVMRFVDLLWVIKPSFEPATLGKVYLDVAVWFSVGSVWLFVFLTFLSKLPLVVENDPRLNDAIAKIMVEEHDDHDDEDEEDASAHA